MVNLTPASAARSRLAVPESALILKRFFFIERELVFLEAGWMPGTRHWESKLLLPELLWEDAMMAHALRERILELRYPERRIFVDDEQPWLDLLHRCGEAPNPTAFLLALASVIKPRLRDAFFRYSLWSDPLDDGPTQRFLRHGIDDLDRQIARLDATSQAALNTFPDDAPSALAWARAVADIFDRLAEDWILVAPPTHAAAPLDPLRRPFSISRMGARDPRFQLAPFAWPDRLAPGNPGEGLVLQARQAVHHVNEVWAAEMAAACIHDFGPGAPHEFLDDAARWCYDEVRHCRMGYERLKEWGFGDAEIPLDSFSYDAGASVDALTRLGIIFYFEATYIHTKKERTVLFAAMGDRLSSHDMDFDWADELIHTYYGKRWLEAFLATSGDPRSLADVKEAARQAVARLLAAATPTDRDTAAAIFDRIVGKLSARRAG